MIFIPLKNRLLSALSTLEFANLKAGAYHEHCRLIAVEIKQLPDRVKQIEATKALSNVIQWYQWRHSSVEEISAELAKIHAILSEHQST